jgi:ABC-type nickel/cobalt efflux system permease component RcnA
LRGFGLTVTVVGGLVFLVSLFADLIGLSDDPGFQIGARQFSAIALGLLVLLTGILILRRSRSG